MFGADPNATVMTEQYGFGAVSDAHKRSMHGTKRGRHGPRWTMESGLV